MKIGWILGWAVPQAWFEPLARAAFPEAAQVFVPAIPDAVALLAAHGPFDWIAGYSLGALLLLQKPVEAGRLGRVALLAPILAFPREANRGGKISGTQVRYLIRQLRDRPEKMLADFYARADLDVPRDAAPPLEPGPLAWGLDCLLGPGVAPPLPAGWQGWCGDKDALLDAEVLHRIDPAIKMVRGATHHPAALLRAFAREVAA